MDEHPRAMVIWLHDAGHVAKCDRLAEALARRGLSLHAVELRYDAKRPDCLADEVCKAVDRPDARALPRFVLGEGAGGVIGLLCALNGSAKIDGLVCAGIPLAPAISGVRLKMLEVMAEVAARTSRRSKARSLVELYRAGKSLHTSIASLATPLLVVHGAADAVAHVRGSEFLHAHAGSRDKTLLIFEGYHHALLDGPGLEPVVGRIARWIDEQLRSTVGRAQISIEYINEPP